MIHILRYGLPLCKFTVKVPADWPPGHEWIHFPDPAREATCLLCKYRLPRQNVECGCSDGQAATLSAMELARATALKAGCRELFGELTGITERWIESHPRAHQVALTELWNRIV